MTFLYILGFIGLALLIFKCRNLGTDLRQKRERRKIFNDRGFKAPKIEIGYHYSWTTFTVTFSKQGDYDLAEKSGLFDEFKNQTRLFFPKPQKLSEFLVPFDPDLAVDFTYLGQRKMSEDNRQG